MGRFRRDDKIFIKICVIWFWIRIEFAKTLEILTYVCKNLVALFDELFLNATVYHLSIEMLESHGNFVKSHFAQTQCCKFTKFCKWSLEKGAYLVGILGQQSILKNHTRGHFLFHKNIKDFAKTHEISYLLSNHWKFSFFERHVFSSKLQFQGCKFTLFSKHCNFFCQNGVFMLNCVVIVYMLQPEIAFFS